ncbi:hypothetical protein AB4113_21290, partial [Vibrio breoganii]
LQMIFVLEIIETTPNSIEARALKVEYANPSHEKTLNILKSNSSQSSLVLSNFVGICSISKITNRAASKLHVI